MRRHYLAATGLVMAMAASPAVAAADGVDAATPEPLLEHAFALAPGRPVMPATGASPANPRDQRVAPAIVPSADLWADLPQPNMRYKAGGTGPLVELGAFNGRIPPLRPERGDSSTGALAHFTFAWNF
ncbi:MAG: hypothetical protein AB7F98_04440 [Novosphingobium sp.]